MEMNAGTATSAAKPVLTALTTVINVKQVTSFRASTGVLSAEATVPSARTDYHATYAQTATFITSLTMVPA